MNKQLLEAYSSVGKGWWPLLEKYIPAILELDPGCTFEPKEKFGELRLQAFPSNHCVGNDRIWELELEAESLSRTICEYCGKPGRYRCENRSWYLTLCDACDALDDASIRSITLEEYVLIGKKYEAIMELARLKELREQWDALPVKNTLRSDAYKAWYRALTYDESSVVMGWNAEAEACMRKKEEIEYLRGNAYE